MTDTNTTPAGDVFLDLQDQWDAAEQALECEAGDAIICRYGPRSFEIIEATSAQKLSPADRIRARAPQPWQDLADDLTDRSTLMGDIEAAAKALHKAGWRKGGDES